MLLDLSVLNGFALYLDKPHPIGHDGCMRKTLHHVKKHTRKHLPTFHNAWHQKVRFPLFRVIFMVSFGIVLLLALLLVFYAPWDTDRIRESHAHFPSGVTRWVDVPLAQSGKTLEDYCVSVNAHCTPDKCVGGYFGDTNVATFRLVNDRQMVMGYSKGDICDTVFNLAQADKTYREAITKAEVCCTFNGGSDIPIQGEWVPVADPNDKTPVSVCIAQGQTCRDYGCVDARTGNQEFAAVRYAVDDVQGVAYTCSNDLFIEGIDDVAVCCGE